MRSLSSVSTNDAGNYTVIISNPYGSVTSMVVTLTVVLPPSILVQPTSQWVVAGSNATLSVTATGTPPLYYSWYLNATNLVQNGTNAPCLVSNVSAGDAGQYMVVVTNAYGSVTSSVATLTVGFAPSLTTQLRARRTWREPVFPSALRRMGPVRSPTSGSSTAPISQTTSSARWRAMAA